LICISSKAGFSAKVLGAVIGAASSIHSPTADAKAKGHKDYSELPLPTTEHISPEIDVAGREDDMTHPSTIESPKTSATLSFYRLLVTLLN
jgi:hypothetical protein